MAEIPNRVYRVFVPYDRLVGYNPQRLLSAPVRYTPEEFLLRIASAFGVSYEQMSGQQETSAAEVEARVEAYRADFKRKREQMELWDAAVLQKVMNDSVLNLFCGITTPKDKLRMWKWEIKQGTITKRAWRRLRGRVKAGKPISEPPAMWIDFDPPPRPMIDFTALYRKD